MIYDILLPSYLFSLIVATMKIYICTGVYRWSISLGLLITFTDGYREKDFLELLRESIAKKDTLIIMKFSSVKTSLNWMERITNICEKSYLLKQQKGELLINCYSVHDKVMSTLIKRTT